MDRDSIIKRFQKAIKIPTISYSDREKIDYNIFKQYISFIKSEYKDIIEKIELKMINDYNFLFKWEGSNSELKPVLFMAHYDVVPIEDETKWEKPPFSGEFDGKYIWGRGTLDDKFSMIAALESVKLLLEKGFKPARTIYLAFGHDEEIGGYLGAKLIKEHFEKENIRFEYVVDEGSVITKGMFPGIDKPIALIGITEKGHVNIEIKVKDKGGHASMPPSLTAAGKIAKIVTLIQESPFKPRVTNTLKQMLKVLAEHVDFSKKLIFKNLSLFKPLILSAFSKSPTTNALIRTTVAPTMLKGSNKENILPQVAYARFNVRTLYPDSYKDVLKRFDSIVEKVIKNKDEYEIKVVDEDDISDPSKEADLDSKSYKTISEILNEMFNDIIVSPFIVVGATDSRYYDDIADNVFKFLPVVMQGDDFEMVHGNNEKISVDNFFNVVNFYKKLIEKTC